MRRNAKIYGAPVLVAAIAALWLMMPIWVRNTVTRKASDALHREVSVRRLSFNPFLLRLTAEGVCIDNRDDSAFIAVDRLIVDLRWTTLVGKPAVDRIVIDEPHIRIRRLSDTTFNFSDLISAEPDRPDTDTREEDKSKPLRIAVIAIQRAHVVVDDHVVTHRHSIGGLHLRATDVSTSPQPDDAPCAVTIDARLNRAVIAATWNGVAAVHAPVGNLSASVRDLALTDYLPYVPEAHVVDVRRAVVDAEAKIRLAGSVGVAPEITVEGSVTLRDVNVEDLEGRPFVNLPHLQVALAPSRVDAGEWHVQHITCDRLRLNIDRLGNGDIAQLTALTPASPGSDAKPAAGRPPIAEQPMLKIDAIMLNAATVRYSDASANANFETIVAPIDLEISGLSTAADTTANLVFSATSEVGELLSIAGNVAVTPPSFSGDVVVDGIPISKYAPFYQPAVRARVLDGIVTVDCEISVTAAPQAHVCVTALNTRVTSLVISGSVAAPDPVVEIPNLHVGGIEAGWPDTDFRIGHVTIDDAVISLERLADGSLNIEHIGAPDAATDAATDAVTEPEPAAGAAAPAIWTVALDRLQLSRWSIDYRDTGLATPVHLMLAVGAITADGLLAENGQRVLLPKLAIADVKLRDVDTDTVLGDLGVFSMTGLYVDSGASSVIVEDITSTSATFNFERSADNKLNWQRPFDRKDIAAVSPAGSTSQADEEPAETETSTDAWQVDIRRAAIRDHNVAWTDHVPSESVTLTLSRIDVTATNITNQPDASSNLDISAQLGEDQEVGITSTFTANPPGGTCSLSLRGIDIPMFQPYFAEQLLVTVVDGHIDAVADIRFMMSDRTPAVSGTGTLSIEDFSVIDNHNGERLFSWDSLSFSGVSWESAPPSLHVEDLTLRAPFCAMVIREDGSMNVTQLVRMQTAASPATATSTIPATAVPAPALSLARVTLENATFQFSDLTASPRFDAALSEFGGKVTGLDSNPETQATIGLHGLLDGRAPISISGAANPFDESLSLDLAVACSNLELSPFTPYSGRYLGYTIGQGKLGVNLRYAVRNRQLSAGNVVVLDQFRLADKVTSDDAIGLPLKQAIALLRDRAGVITLDVPIEGDLDDPEFKIGRTIIRTLRNMLTRVVTSPFAALASVVGSEQPLDVITFQPGNAQVDAANHAILKSLAKALHSRPGVNLGIRGSIEPEQDARTLRVRLLEQNLVRAKLRDDQSRGKVPVPAADVVLSDEERRNFLREAFVTLRQPIESNGDGSEEYDDGDKAEGAKDTESPDATSEQMRAAVLDSITCSSDDLRHLANSRAKAVSDYLVENGKIDPERLFIIGYDEAAPETGSVVRLDVQ